MLPGMLRQTMRPLCCTLSKAVEISEYMPVTLSSGSKTSQISCVILMS
jgi:hypothetical protein